VTKAYPQIRMQAAEPTPVMTMIVPGRRAYGEEWRKVVVSHDGNGYTVDNAATDAPADGQPIFVPAMGEISLDMADYILEYQRKEAEYRKAHGTKNPPLPSPKKIQEMFWNYCEERLKWFKGQTTSGPVATTQRQRLPR